MSAASSVCSDDSFEIVNNELETEEQNDDVFSMYKPKVTFHEVFDVYPMDADIVARITYDNDFVKSDEDTVIVLPIAWKSIDQGLCSASIVGNYVRFDVKELPKIGAEDKFYQLCYCTVDKIVMGVSIPFSFREVHEDELIEFQKEQNKEFWTFRSRFAVLMDIYWNSLLEKKMKVDSVENSTSVDNLDELFHNDFQQPQAGTSDVESNLEKNHKILLFKLMKNEYEELKKKYDEEHQLHLHYKNKFRSCRYPFEKIDPLNSADLTDESIDVEKNCSVFEYKLLKCENEEMKLKYEDQQQSIQEYKSKYEDAKKDIYLLKKFLQEVALNLKSDEVIGFKDEGLVRRVLKKFPNGEFDGIWRFATWADPFKVEEKIDEIFAGGAAFIATDNGNIILSEGYTDPSKCNKQNSQESVSDDWKAQKAQLLEKCSKLEHELSNRNIALKNLNEALIRQRNCEHEKIISVTDTVRDRYIAEVNQLRETKYELQDKIKVKDEEIKQLNGNILEMSKLLTANEEEIKNLKARDHSLVGFLERRNLRRITELEDRLHDMYAKLWVERRESIQLREEKDTLDARFNSLCEEMEKLSTETTAGTSAQGTVQSDTETLASGDAEMHNANLNSSFETVPKKLQKFFAFNTPSPFDQCSSQATNSAQTHNIQESREDELAEELKKAKEREQGLATKLVEISAELQNMKCLYEKTKTDLELRLKDGAKQYAKLYLKYEKHVKHLKSSTPQSSA